VSYKIYLWDNLSPIEWSQAAWRIEGTSVAADACEGEFIHEVMLRHLPRQGLIVDAGCGTAKWPIYLRSRGYRCVGLEISHDACRMARTIDPGLPVIGADLRHIPLADASVDAILSLGVVEHDEAGPLDQLRELRRILKPGGTLVIAVPFNNLFRRLIWNRLMDRVTRRRREKNVRLGFAEYRFTQRELRGFLRATGFEPLASYPNDLRPPKVMGLWVDYNNLFDPLSAPPGDLFVLTGWKGRIGRALVRWCPWLVCGETTIVASTKAELRER
jgi:SAM-dependent methyltransferase